MRPHNYPAAGHYPLRHEWYIPKIDPDYDTPEERGEEKGGSGVRGETIITNDHNQSQPTIDWPTHPLANHPAFPEVIQIPHSADTERDRLKCIQTTIGIVLTISECQTDLTVFLNR